MDPVAITGIGVVSPLGIGYDAFAEAALLGVSALAPWSGGDAATPLVGEVLDWSVAPYLVAEKTYLDRASEFALAAAKLCLDQAGLATMPAEPERSGLVLGTAYGCASTAVAYTARVRKRGTRFATPLLFTHGFINTPASLLAIDFRLRGHHATVTSGRASGLLALHTALTALATGQADAILCGGVEALCPELLAAHQPALARVEDADDFDPFAGGGTLLGEGAALLLLEPLHLAVARGATPLAVLGLPSGTGADLTLTDHAGGVRSAKAPTSGHITAPAGLYGDCLGAAGALATALGVAALAAGCVPPVRYLPTDPAGAREAVEANLSSVDVVAANAGGEVALRLNSA